jgi:hypothetical protein
MNPRKAKLYLRGRRKRMKVEFKKHSHLIEGVSNGFTFSLLGDDNVTLHTPAQCKDYLQDLWWSENHKKATEVWGFTWQPGTIKLGQPVYRFALRDDRSSTLLDRKDGIISFINYFESCLGWPLSTIETTDEANVLVLNLVGEWTQSCPMISAFTTITRLGMLYKGGDGIEYVADLISKFKAPTKYGEDSLGFPPAMQADMGRIKIIFPRLKLLASGKFPKPAWAEFDSGYKAHEGGIVNYQGWGC